MKLEDLDKMHQTRMGEMPARFLIMVATNNMSYHTGQINYIQTLYGDTEFRFPRE